MVTVTINENTPAGKRILKEIVSNPHIGQVNMPNPILNKSDNVAGYVSVDEYFSKLKATVRSKYQEINRESL